MRFFFFFLLLLHVSCEVDILSWSSEPEWVCTTENSQWNLYSSNPLIASWQNVYTILSNSILPVNGKAGRDIMFCIKPLKPLLHNVVCLFHFDHIDIFTSEVIPNLFWGKGWRWSDSRRRLGVLPYKTTVTIISCFCFFKLPLLLDCVDQHKECHNSFKSYVNNQ